MVLESLSTAIGNSLTNDVSYWLLVIIISFFVFLAMKVFDIPKVYAGITALLLTVFLLEFFLKALFGLVSIPLNFGTYIVDIPFFAQIAISDGVMLMRFLDFVFNFGLVRLVGIPYYDTFMAQSGFATAFVPPVGIIATLGSVISSPFNIFVFLYVSVDSIIEYVFFYYLFYAIIIFVTDVSGADTRKWESLSYLFALIPVLLYNWFVSNPVYEYGRAVPELQKVFYFLNHGDMFSIIMFFGTLIVSFLLVMEILAATITFFYSTGENTFRPDWVSKQWEVNTQGLGFVYTLAFAIMYAMHQYAWYVFFPAMVIYSLFKKFSSGSRDVAREHNEKQEMRDYVQTLVNSGGSPPGDKGNKEGTDIVFWFVLIALVGVIGYILVQLEWMPFL